MKFLRAMKKLKIKKQIIAAVMACVLGIGGIYSVHASVINDAKNKKNEAQQELDNLNSQIDEIQAAQSDLQEEMDAYDDQLMALLTDMDLLEHDIDAKQGEIDQANADLEVAQEKEQTQYNAMKMRIRYMYENSQTTYLEQLLESNSVAEFLNTAEYIAEIQKYDRQKLDEYTENIEYITVAKEQLEQDYADLENMKANVESQKQSVAALMSQKETELAGITSNISDAQEDAKYFEAEIQAQNELIAEIKRIEAEKAAAAAKAAAEGKEVADNPYTGGAFTWPCPSSTRVTSDYGTRVSPTSGASSNHKGIDIGASAGAAIVAAANGTVKAANYSSAAGNYVMIDHGGGLYTVYMHCSSLAVSEGTAVSAGQTIAYVGSTGISTGNHLHFGVSLNGSYVSPWSYLKG